MKPSAGEGRKRPGEQSGKVVFSKPECRTGGAAAWGGPRAHGRCLHAPALGEAADFRASRQTPRSPRPPPPRPQSLECERRRRPGPGPSPALGSANRTDGRPFPAPLGAERPYLRRTEAARSRGLARRTAARGPRLPPKTRPCCLRRRFALGGSATAAARAVYTVRPLTPPPPPSLHPSAAADPAAATSSAAAWSLWSIFQPPDTEKQRLQPRRQETPPQLPGGGTPGGQSTSGFSAIEQRPHRSFCNPLPAPPPFSAPPQAPPTAATHWDSARVATAHDLLKGMSISVLPPSPAPRTLGASLSPPTRPRLCDFNFPLGVMPTSNWQGQLSIKHRPSVRPNPLLPFTLFSPASALLYLPTSPACPP